MKKMRRATTAAAVSSALLAMFAQPALAQTAETPKEEAKSPQKLEQINVIAENPQGFKAKTVQVGAFRDQDILEVPLTVNVIPRAVIDAQDARGAYDALKNTAGVSRAQLGGTTYDNLAVRGVPLQNRTNYRLNGSLPIVNLIELPMENKERVEALKGASSLYYGFTTPVGVINVVTRRAQAKPNFSAGFSGNEFGQLIGYVDGGTKFGADSQFGIRTIAGYGTLATPQDDSDGKRSLFSTAFDWTATRELSFRLDYEYFKKENNEPGIVKIPNPINNVVFLPDRPNPKNQLISNWARHDADSNNALARADYTISDNWFMLAEVGRAQTTRNKRDYSEVNAFSNATGEGTLLIQLLRDLDYVNKNARIELGGRVEFYGRHDITVGYMRNTFFQAGPNAQNYTTTQNLYNPRPIPEFTRTAPIIYSPINQKDTGAYLLDRITWGDLQVTAAIRRTDYESVSTTNTATTSTTTRYETSPTTESYAALYRIRPDTSVYASYIEGLEQGPIAPTTAANAGEVFPAAVSKQKEIGVRSEALRGLMAQLAYFNIERTTSYTNAANFLVLDGRTEIKGWEFALSGELSKEFSIYASGSKLDAKLTQATAALQGKFAEATPKEFLSTLVEYKPAYVPGLSLNLGAYYTGRRWITPANQAEISGYTIITAGAGYRTRIADKTVTFQLNVNNLNDKDYWEAGGAGYMAVGFGRAISFTAKIDFF